MLVYQPTCRGTTEPSCESRHSITSFDLNQERSEHVDSPRSPRRSILFPSCHRCRNRTINKPVAARNVVIVPTGPNTSDHIGSHMLNSWELFMCGRHGVNRDWPCLWVKEEPSKRPNKINVNQWTCLNSGLCHLNYFEDILANGLEQWEKEWRAHYIFIDWGKGLSFLIQSSTLQH